jgi:Leucine-rich repeat (LRR) protein
LDLSTNNITIMEGLGNMTKLRELKLYSCYIGRIQNLEQCVSLMALHLEDNHISIIEGLDACRALDHLNLDCNRIQKIGKGLAKLTKLRELYLSRNQLSSLDGIANLALLETCAVEQNRLRQITAEQVKGLAKLDELRLAGNQLQSLSFLAAGKTLPSLVQLDVSNNNLSAASLQSLPPLPQLSDLNLAGNHIDEISPNIVSSFPSLEILDLTDNKLYRGAEDVQVLKEIVSIRELLIKGNPFATQWDPLEMKASLESISSLEFLDDCVVEKKPEVNTLSLEASDQEDTDTFRLTLTKGIQENIPARPSSANSRPGTASSRPGTASSRPGTAQKMSDAGVRDPLMFTKPKLSEKRFASAEQVETWEKNTITSLLSVKKQIDKTCQHMDAEMADMTKFLQKADQILQKEKEFNARRPVPPDDANSQVLPTLRSATIADANASLAAEAKAAEQEHRRPSKIKFRLREALDESRTGEESEQDDAAPDSPPARADIFSPVVSPNGMSPSFAAFDEEIEEEGLASEEHVVPSPEPEAQEVEEEELHVADIDIPPRLGPRAERAMATVAAKRAESPDLRVETRAKERANPQRRPSPQKSARSLEPASVRPAHN